MDSRNKLRIVFGDVTVGIHGEDFHYIFSKQTGGMESLVKAGKEWLYLTSSKPVFHILQSDYR